MVDIVSPIAAETNESIDRSKNGSVFTEVDFRAIFHHSKAFSYRSRKQLGRLY
jgi:hypothetical protein